MMNGNLRVGSLFGIPFYLNISWFFVLALVTLNYTTGLSAEFPWLDPATALVLGLMTALFLFTSVVLHELGHSFAARQQGIAVHSITLFLFGGLANLERESDRPAGAFWVAIAGPLVSLALFGGLTAIGLVVPLAAPLAAIVTLLAYINLALALFNLIPGLPLDGGNVLKALVWKLTGNRYQGTRVASWIGQGIGWIAISVGALSVLGFLRGGSLWTVLIGWFLLQNAGQAAQSATFEERLSDLTAGDAVTPESPIVEADWTLRQLVDWVALNAAGQWRRFLVKDAAGKLVGALPLSQLQTLPSSRWSDYTVRDLTQPIASEVTITPTLPLVQVLAKLQEQGASSLTVVQENGVLVGLLEKISVVRLLQGRSEVQPAQ